jgi:ribonuclease HI
VSKSRAGRLGTVNQRATLLIAGTLRTSATDLSEAHANLQPIDLIINRLAYRSALRLAMLPTSHPLHKRVARASGRYVQHHRSPLHNLLHTYHIDPKQIETLKSVMHSPGWIPALQTSIAPNEKEAIKADANDNADVKVYANGSGIDGNIGAAAVTTLPKCELHFHLSTEDEHIVYEAKVVGLLLALQLLLTLTRAFESATIAIDNQAAIQGIAALCPTSTHHLWEQIDAAAAKLKMTGKTITVRWVPGHRNVEGNEAADNAAKEAACGQSSALHRLPHALRRPLATNRSALKAGHKKQLSAAHQRRLTTESPQYFNGYSRIDPSSSPTQYRKLVRGLTRPQESILAQLRTGHTGLNAFLHMIKQADSPLCPVCNAHKETTFHFLFRCPNYHAARSRIPRVARTFEGILNTRTHLPALFTFIVSTTTTNFNDGSWDPGGAKGARNGARGGGINRRGAPED